MPARTSVCKFNSDTGKCEWSLKDDTPKESASPVVHGPLDFTAVGLPGQPHITSRSQYKALLKQHNCEEVGNETSHLPDSVREQIERGGQSG